MANAYMLMGKWRRNAVRVVMTAIAAATLVACVPVDRPGPSARIASVEASKQDIARQRNRGVYSYEEAARAQFEIERASYALSAKDLDTWNLAILYARQYDARLITLQQYKARTGELFTDYGKRRQ